MTAIALTPSRPRAPAIFMILAPATLGALEIFHPHPHDLFYVDLTTWLIVHYAQILLFPLAALAVTMLVRDQNGVVAMVCRVSMFTFAMTYIAFDTAAGVVTGILIKAARHAGMVGPWRPALDAVWTHPIVGGSGASLLGVAGAIALSVGTVAAAVARRRAGASWPPVLLLGLSGFGVSVFKTHAWPGGPLTFGGIAIAVAWLLLERSSLASADAE